MTIPPFPSQDLAKLVLGYLAEEQLMTAYDEFLQASPYLDALRNEYDRIFMTSLKNILAEYRAVKIYVETCKPFALRKKLLQYTNLLDAVKFLVYNIDVNKIQTHETSTEKISVSKQNTSSLDRHNVCETCNLSNCFCKSKQSKSNYSNSNVGTSFETSVETTALEDLPGNLVSNRKKHIKVLEKDAVMQSSVALHDSTKQSCSMSYSIGGLMSSNDGPQIKSNENNSASSLSCLVKGTDTQECRDKIEEFNNILNKVCTNKSNIDNRVFTMLESQHIDKRSSNGFQNFSSGISGHENRNVPVPDSSTSENLVAQSSVGKDNSSSNSISDGSNPTMLQYPRMRSNIKDQKIKIISDIKVNNSIKDNHFNKMNNATSTPLMQTIVINGTPAYGPKLPANTNNYTKDEIMAMPTIIVVPASGPPQKMTQRKPVVSQNVNQATTNTVTSTKMLGPLIIDVSTNSNADDKAHSGNQPILTLQNRGNDTGLVKTVDVPKNASVPKDNIIPCSLQTNTPQVLPPVRKSSSTPRRNSHIRVLDFTTPRRILHETINEVAPNVNNDNIVDVVSRSPNVVFPTPINNQNDIIDMSNVKVHKIETCHITNMKRESSPATPVINKKSNWDADLRALAIANEKNIPPPKTKPRNRKPKSKPEKSKELDESGEKETKKSRIKRKASPKLKKTKKRKKLEEEEAQYEESIAVVDNKVTVKPTFNIVTDTYKNTSQDAKNETDNNKNKSNNEDVNETPEAERLSLQNEIGAKLNISDLLETPYKQVLYDIQMETPKFLGPDLPGEPISDIKIMNIPTPRFFDTPKPIATPSSYSSRPTDYSSGGSYYKPDEQDYFRIQEIECPVTSSKEEPPVVEPPKKIESDSKKNSRPVRKCTKNVSYYNSSNVANKIKEKHCDDKTEIASSCSESTSINSSFDNTKENIAKTPKVNKIKPHPKSDKKRTESSKKYKSPLKKDKSNTFMKIKPRRLTPTKNNSSKKSRRKTDILHNNSSKSQVKRKSSVKEKNLHVTPIVVPAPTKSRRKSSTPRKLHCTKTFNSESSGHDSPEMKLTDGIKSNTTRDDALVISHDSDTEQLALRWSDDGSQDAKHKVSECEDISKIQEYIQASDPNRVDYCENRGTFQVDLIKRGFDAETAKIIERDLLDPSPLERHSSQIITKINEPSKNEITLEKSLETVDTSAGTDLQIVQDEETEDDEFELSAYECNEESDNYIVCNSEAKENLPKGQPATLKDKFSMEVCIDGVAIRLRATNFNILFDEHVPKEEEFAYSFRETEVAVSSISNIDKLYTPLKDHRAQCYEIFDSTLTSLDTPLKVNSPNKEHDSTEIQIVLEEEKTEDEIDSKKRKRSQGSNNSEDGSNQSKKTKAEAQFLLKSTNIKNIDIETVLTKLHGP